jgi:hypothetical protein
VLEDGTESFTCHFENLIVCGGRKLQDGGCGCFSNVGGELHFVWGNAEAKMRKWPRTPTKFLVSVTCAGLFSLMTDLLVALTV